jgi:uncharacterized SAM-binding protein YcdF (DUF218 family)
VIHVIFSGGDTARVNKTEANVMKEVWDERYEINKGNPYNVVLHLEHQSLSTCQNAYYSVPILQQIRHKHAPYPLFTVLVTSDFHVARARLLFEQVFRTVLPQHNETMIVIDSVRGAPTTDPVLRQNLFQNERYWLQPQSLEKLLHQMSEQPFQLPTAQQIQQANEELNRWE